MKLNRMSRKSTILLSIIKLKSVFLDYSSEWSAVQSAIAVLHLCNPVKIILHHLKRSQSPHWTVFETDGFFKCYCVYFAFIDYLYEWKKLLKLPSLLNHTVVKIKDINFLFEGQGQIESKLYFILIEAWTPLSPSRQSKNQHKQTNTLLATASSWQTVVYHKSLLLKTFLRVLVSFLLATVLRKKPATEY